MEGEKGGLANRSSMDTSLAIKLSKKENYFNETQTNAFFFGFVFRSSKIKVLTKGDRLLNISTSTQLLNSHSWMDFSDTKHIMKSYSLIYCYALKKLSENIRI